MKVHTTNTIAEANAQFDAIIASRKTAGTTTTHFDVQAAMIEIERHRLASGQPILGWGVKS